VTKGQRVIPKRTVALGYTYQHPDLDEALASAVG
jgi:NAD dependent epimerase/dehydratase family enzyme